MCPGRGRGSGSVLFPQAAHLVRSQPCPLANTSKSIWKWGPASVKAFVLGDILAHALGGHRRARVGACPGSGLAIQLLWLPSLRRELSGSL